MSGRFQSGFDWSLLTDSSGHGNLEKVDATPKDDDTHQHRWPGLNDVAVFEQHKVAHVEQP